MHISLLGGHKARVLPQHKSYCSIYTFLACLDDRDTISDDKSHYIAWNHGFAVASPEQRESKVTAPVGSLGALDGCLQVHIVDQRAVVQCHIYSTTMNRLQGVTCRLQLAVGLGVI